VIRLRRASAIVALSLLTSAGTAYAECAWVLWGEMVHRGNRRLMDCCGQRGIAMATEHAKRNVPKGAERAWSGSGER
jgi:hypothetical protein